MLSALIHTLQKVCLMHMLAKSCPCKCSCKGYCTNIPCNHTQTQTPFEFMFVSRICTHTYTDTHMHTHACIQSRNHFSYIQLPFLTLASSSSLKLSDSEQLSERFPRLSGFLWLTDCFSGCLRLCARCTRRLSLVII